MSTPFEFILENETCIIKVNSLLNELENRKIILKVEELVLDEYIQYIVDLEELEFLNSSGLNLLLGILTRSRNEGGDTFIINISEQADKLLVVTKLKEVFTVLETKEAALKSFEEMAKKVE